MSPFDLQNILNKAGTVKSDRAGACEAAKSFFGQGNTKIETYAAEGSPWVKALGMLRDRARSLGLAAAITLSALTSPAMAQTEVEHEVFAGPSNLTAEPNQERYVRMGKLPIDVLLKVRDRIGLSEEYVARSPNPPLGHEMLNLPLYEARVIQSDMFDALDRLVKHDGDPHWERLIDAGYVEPDAQALEESLQLIEQLIIRPQGDRPRMS